jgi:hypothetical protein
MKDDGTATVLLPGDLQLEKTGVKGQLVGTRVILNAHFHVEFVQVYKNVTATTAVNSVLQNRIDAVGEFDEGDSYQPVQYDGRYWFVIIIPFQK